MKFMKFFAFSAIAMMASLAFADAANVCVMFSTKGPDLYADGTTVVNGEWYALVWVANGAELGGVTTRLEAVRDDNQVMLAAPLASGGRCPLVMWQVDSAKAKTSGNYRVVMLDTRGSDGKPATRDADGKPKVVYSMTETSAQVAASGSFSTSGLASSIAGSATAASGTEGVEKPTIESFAIVGANVQITVAGMVPGLTYKVTTGDDPSNLSATDFVVPQKDDATTDTVKGVVIMPATEAKFFSIQGE